MSVRGLQIACAPATQEDIDAIFKMAKNLIDTYEDVNTIDYDKVIMWVHNKISQNINQYQCVKSDGVKVGYYRLHTENGETELDDLYILSEFRNRGIGTAILEKCITGTPMPLFLYVFKRNIRAIKLYSRMGFSISKDIGNTRYIMRRDVDRP